MTDHSERDEAAAAYPFIKKEAPDEPDKLVGFCNAFIREKHEAFAADADWAVKNDPRVINLVEALKLLLMDTQHDDHTYNEETCPVLNANEALKKWSKYFGHKSNLLMSILESTPKKPLQMAYLGTKKKKKA